MTEVNIFIAFLTGLVSFVTPCNLAIAPLFLSYLSRQLTEDSFVKHERNLKGRIVKKVDPLRQKSSVILGTVIYSVGFVCSLLFLALTVRGIGWTIKHGSDSFFDISGHHIAGLIIILFGLIMIFGKRFLFLQREYKIDLNRFKNINKYLFPFVIGVTAAIAWTPCLGPILGTIYTLTASSSSALEGATYLLFFGFGNVVPFFVLAILGDKSRPIIQKLTPYSNYLYTFTGIMIILLGFLIFTNKILDIYLFIERIYSNFGYQGL